MTQDNQLRVNPTGGCCHAWCLTVVIRLLALCICIALAYAQSATFQQQVLEEVCLREAVTADCERSYNYRSHLAEYTAQIDYNYCQQTHVRDEAQVVLSVLTARQCDERLILNHTRTPCQKPFCLDTCSSEQQWLLNHTTYYDNSSNRPLWHAGSEAFCYCHPRSHQLMNTGIHATPRLPALAAGSNPILAAKYPRGVRTEKARVANRTRKAYSNDDSFSSKYRLQPLIGLQYQNAQASGAELSESMGDSLSWMQRIVWKDFATAPGSQDSPESFRKYFVSLAKQAGASMTLPKDKVYVDSSTTKRLCPKGAGPCYAAKPQITDTGSAGTFLSSYDIASSPFAHFQLYDHRKQVVKGAPSATI